MISCLFFKNWKMERCPFHFLNPYLVSIRKLRMRHYWFPIQKRGFFCPGKEIEGLCGGVHRYAAQASPKIEAARALSDFILKPKCAILAHPCNLDIEGVERD